MTRYQSFVPELDHATYPPLFQLPKHEYMHIARGDKIIIYAKGKKRKPDEFPPLVYPVIYNRHYEGLEDVFKAEGINLARLLSDVDSIKEGISYYCSIPLKRINKNHVKEHGISAIGLGERL